MLKPATGAMTAATRPCWRLFAAALLFVAGNAGAQRLDLADEQVLGAERSDDGGLWLHVVDRRHGANRTSSVLELSPRLEIEREMTLSGLAPFANGMLEIVKDPAPRGAPEELYRLVWTSNARLPQQRTLFSWTSRDDPTFGEHAAVAPDGSGIYLMHGNREKPSVVKLSAEGEVLWGRDLLAAQLADIVATPDGMISVHRSRGGGSAVLALSTNGHWLWSAEVPVSSRDVEFVPPRTLALVSWQGGGELVQLELIDVIDRTRRTVTMPGALPRVSPVTGGMLFASHALGQPLIALIDDAGVVRWTRRLQLMGADRFDRKGHYTRIEVQPLGVNGIAVIASWQDLEAGPRTRVVAGDFAGLALASEYGRCLSEDALRIITLEATLQRDYGIGVELGARVVERRPVAANGCALPSDTDYLRFLENFTDELVRLNVEKVKQYSRDIRVTVDSFENFGLLGYRFMAASSDAALTEIEYAATADAGRLLARSIAERARPHLERMRDIWIAFRKTTGCSLTVLDFGRRGVIDDATFYAAIEQKAESVVAAARLLMTGFGNELERSADRCVLVINDEEFGTYKDGFQPHSELDSVLRKILDR